MSRVERGKFVRGQDETRQDEDRLARRGRGRVGVLSVG